MTVNHSAIGFGHTRVLHLIPHLVRGGAELQLCQLAEDQADDDTSVTVGCFSVTPDLRDRLERANVTIHTVREGRRTFLRRLLPAAREADIVHAWMYHGFLMSAALRPVGRCPHIWSVRRTDPGSAGLRRRTRGVIWLTKSLSRRVADGIIYCSTAAEAAHRAAGFGSRSHTVIYNSVRIPEQAIATSDTRAGRIGFLGRWNADKGLDVLFAAWQVVTRHVQGVELVVAGPGLTADAEELGHAIESVGLDPRPILLGPIDDPDSFLRTLDCLVSPSRTEGFPNVVAEAMAAALPVIATRVGGTPEVLADCGELVAPDDPESLANAIISFVQDPLELRVRAHRGRTRAISEFSRERALRSTNDFYDVVTESRTRRRRRGRTIG